MQCFDAAQASTKGETGCSALDGGRVMRADRGGNRIERGMRAITRVGGPIVGVVCLTMLALGCPDERRDKRAADSARAAAIPVDTTPMDLSKVETSLPPSLPDTFKGPAKPVARREGVREPPIPPAPPALMDAVQREGSSSRFCYQEFGQKVDPTLKGGVAFVVSVGSGGITNARIASDSWSSKAGAAVNRCLDDRASSAWKLAAGAVPAGKYIVRMTFTGK